jgi:hypothetical protein
LILAVVVGVAVSALGALILGEYEFNGAMPFVAGPLFGLVVGEIVLAVGRQRSFALGVGLGLVVAVCLLWAAWIASGDGLRPLPAAIWPAMVLGGLLAGSRVGRSPAAPPGVGFERTPPAPPSQGDVGLDRTVFDFEGDRPSPVDRTIGRAEDRDLDWRPVEDGVGDEEEAEETEVVGEAVDAEGPGGSVEPRLRLRRRGSTGGV